ncbi:hypothetical protein J2Y55_003194 [Bosea sp. BE125]|nr:hypothetical protein [Bosea sp. BE125]
MARQDGERADLAGFIVGGDMDHGEPLGGARHALSSLTA